MNTLKNIKILVLMPFFILNSIIHTQNASKDSITETTNKDTKTFNAPSSHFVPIVLQTHNGLLRFGVQNSYKFYPDGSFKNYDAEKYKVIEVKKRKLLEGQQAFTELLRMKYMADKYKDLDKAYFTVFETSMYKNEKNSWLAQQQLLKLANMVSSSPLFNKHFCNPKIENCDDTSKHDHRGNKQIKPWGGQGANEFKKLNNYTSYVSAHLEPLQKWSANLIKDNTIDAYLVFSSRLSAYDFKVKGYWLYFDISPSNWPFLRFFNLAPNTIHERKLTSSKTSSILYKMAVDEAEQFAEGIKKIHIVFKVKAVLEGLDHTFDGIKTSFTLQNSAIELYDNEDLKTKIGEILIDETLTVK